VFFDRLDADVQKTGDFLVGVPFGQQFQHFALPLRERIPA
jgi:hypothetical protein